MAKNTDTKVLRAEAVQAIKRLRKRMTIQALAQALETGTATVQRWEHGKAVPYRHAALRILRLAGRK